MKCKYDIIYYLVDFLGFSLVWPKYFAIWKTLNEFIMILAYLLKPKKQNWSKNRFFIIKLDTIFIKTRLLIKKLGKSKNLVKILL